MSSEPDATAVRRITRAGDYDLLRKMGSGGFGVVYEARHRQTGLLFAIKRVELTLEDAERFRKEALYPAQIASRSLHVLGVHSFFHDPISDAFYLVTELIPHGDLKTFLAQRPKPLALAQGLHLGSGIAKGLSAIHALGIVHRDLKPANVLMDKKDGQWVPKIADFGLARSHSSVSLGEFASSGYASPEQLDLLSDRPVGTESDLFSFGMVLYELLTGDRASPAADLREYGRWIKDRRPPPAPSVVRPELARFVAVDTLIASLIEFEPSRRTTSAATCAKVLQDALLALARTGSPRPPASSSQPQMPVAPPPVPTPVPLPAAVPEPPVVPVPVPLVGPPPMPATDPGVGPIVKPVAPPKPTRRRTTWVLAAIVLVAVAVVSAGGWWGWQIYSVRTVAQRGQAYFKAHDFGRALPLLTRAAEGGDAVSQGMLGKIYARGLDHETDYDAARLWAGRAAAQDDPGGLAGLGYGLLFGRGVTADPARGVSYLRQAAERGDDMGHTFLGWAYENGTGVDPNQAEAARQYRLATGDHYAMYLLARMYEDGRGGLSRSIPDALKLYREAARIGHTESKCGVAVILVNRYEDARRRTGRGDDDEVKEAVGSFSGAADQKMACGELGLGYMYERGYGVEPSYDTAVGLYERASAHGSEVAKSNLTKIEGQWILPPMFLGAWRQVTGDERRDEIARLRKAGVIDRLRASDVQRLRRIEVDFYEDATIFELEIARASAPRGIYTYVRHAGQVVTINGDEAPIGDLNRRGPIRIDSMARAISYLRFMMAAYQNQSGDRTTYRLVDSGNDVPWLSGAADYIRSGVAAQIAPAQISPSSSGGWEALVCAQHGSAVNRMTLWLLPDGTIRTMKAESLGGDALPIAQERFDEQGLRIRVSS